MPPLPSRRHCVSDSSAAHYVHCLGAPPWPSATPPGHAAREGNPLLRLPRAARFADPPASALSRWPIGHPDGVSLTLRSGGRGLRPHRSFRPPVASLLACVRKTGGSPSRLPPAPWLSAPNSRLQGRHSRFALRLAALARLLAPPTMGFRPWTPAARWRQGCAPILFGWAPQALAIEPLTATQESQPHPAALFTIQRVAS